MQPTSNYSHPGHPIELDSHPPAQVLNNQNTSYTDEIIDAIIPDARSKRVRNIPAPLPLPSLIQYTQTADVVYSFSKVDNSGRIADKTIIQLINWIPREHIDLQLAHNTIILQPHPAGVFHAHDSRRIKIPLEARRYFDIRPHDRLLLCAISPRRTVIIYPQSTVQAAFWQYHQSQATSA